MVIKIFFSRKIKLIKVSDVILDPQSVKKELIKTEGIENHQHSDFVGRKERGWGDALKVGLFRTLSNTYIEAF